MCTLKCNLRNKAKTISLRLFFLFFLFFISIKCFAIMYMEVAALDNPIIKIKTSLNGGWYTLDPYQYQKNENGILTLTGLDYELIKAISEEICVKINYEKIFWEDILKLIKQGSIDFTTGALYSAERAEYSYFSDPYRFEEESLFVLRNSILNKKYLSIEQLLAFMKQNRLKLAIVNGYIYADNKINAFINDPDNHDLIVRTNNDYENLNMLLDNDVDAFLADRIVGSTMIWRSTTNKLITEIRLNSHIPIHIIFSKKTVDKQVVEQFNQAINKIKSSEKYQKIVSLYLYPVLFLQTKDANWFMFTEIVGIIAFAISGLIIAFKDRATLFGALILAILPSLGGGIIRDIILGRSPVGILTKPIYLSCVLLTVIGGFGIIKLLTHFRKTYPISAEIEDLFIQYASYILMITDAIGLAMFTIMGVITALLMKAEPLWIWGPFFAFVTGAGGGILRDMLSKTRHIAALEGEMYGEIAIVWGLILSLFITTRIQDIQPEYIHTAVLITALGVFVSRIIFYTFKIPNIQFGHAENRSRDLPHHKSSSNHT